MPLTSCGAKEAPIKQTFEPMFSVSGTVAWVFCIQLICEEMKS